MNEPRLIKCSTVGDDSHGLRHLQWGDLSIPLSNGKVRDIAVQDLAAMSGLHVIIVRHASIHFAAQRNTAFGPETKPKRPIDDWFCTDFDADLVKPGVARFGQRLHKIKGTAVRLFPVVKDDIPDRDGRQALKFVVRPNGPTFERGNSNRDLEG